MEKLSYYLTLGVTIQSQKRIKRKKYNQSKKLV